MESQFACEPHNNQHAAHVLHAVLNTENFDEPFTPSKYFHEMKMSLEDRVESLCKIRKNRILPQPSPFLATPDMVIFQNYQLGKWYNVTLTLQNKEQSSRCVKIIFESTVHFRLVHPCKVIWTKVAPGMTYQVIISFCGDELKDYQHQVSFVTEENQFSIPIYAFKPKPLIDFPDLVKLPETPIHMSSEKNIIICNHGLSSGTFSIIATYPCTVCPSKATLAPKEKMFLKISLKTETSGPLQSVIVVKFDDEVELKILVECNAVCSTIHLQRDSICFEDTFIGLQRQIPLMVRYHAIGHGYFKWKSYKNTEIEKAKKDQLTDAFMQIRHCETLKALPLARMNLVDPDGHAVVYERIFADEVEEMETREEFLFRNRDFRILPLTGEIGASGSLEFTIFFSPTSCEANETAAYLEIAGNEERIQLKLQGTGLGPQFKLNVAHLEANNVFLRSVHDYEIVAANTGHIPGTLMYHDKPLQFGGQIKCDPATALVNPEHYAVFVISFKPGEEGRFIETVEFVIKESKEKIHFVITGNVIAPLLSLRVKEIDFGIAAFGYPKSREIALCNNSPVPIQYHIRIIDDGHQNPINCDMFLEDYSIVSYPRHPQEFRFEPEQGVVEEYSEIIGTLHFLPNVRRQVKTQFVVHMWGSKNYCTSIPLKYDCRVADVVCTPSKVDIKFCFINYVYDRKLILKNLSDLPCLFQFMPGGDGVNVISSRNNIVSIQKDDGLIVEVEVSQNHIEPLSEVTLSLKIQTPTIGQQEIPLYFDIFGKGPDMFCHVICNGQGPSISFIPPKLNFGIVFLLNKVTEELEIINDTPIPASVNFFFKSPSPFSLDETKKTIHPNSRLKVQITVYLADPGRSTYTLWAQVEQGQAVPVVLSVFGEGTSISCTPKLEPRLELGTLLTFKKFSFPILLRNEGSRWHKLWFSRSENYKTAKHSTTSSANFSSVFKIVPNYFHLMTKESVEIQISASRKEQGYICERFYCHAVIEKSHKTHIILIFDVVARFLDPHVELNKSELNFNIDVSSDGVFASLKDKIKIRNECGLGLEIELVTSPPFYIVSDNQAVSLLYVKLNNLSNRYVYVEFQPPPHQKRCVSYNQMFYVNYKDHPKVDNIPVRGDINYPTLTIDPPMIDFGCVPLGSSTYRPIILNNISSLPVVYKWVWADNITEIKNPPSKVQTATLENNEEKSASNPKVEEKLSEDFSENSCVIDDDLRNRLSTLVGDIEENDHEPDFLRSLLKRTQHEKRKIFDMIPHEACLEPNESLLTNIRFTPNSDTDVSGTIYCHIVGGGVEPMTLKGKCRVISYYLSRTHINFGRIYFYEVSENETLIVNDGESNFSFLISNATLPNGWLTIDPSTNSIFPGESFPLYLKCFPGCVGRFETTFQVEIGYLEPITVTVSGFGVYPQIYFTMPRPNLAQVDPFISYSAVAELGNDANACQCAPEFFPETDRRILENDDWVIISMSDDFPCTMEIELSVERLCARFVLSGQPNILERLASGEKIWPIPNFVVAPYLYDLGSVQIQSRTHHTLTFFNFGPGRTVVRAQTSPNFNKNGFEMSFTKRMIDLNKTTELHFTFHPTVNKFPEPNCKITEFIYIDVRNGARIPIQIDAVVATPIVTAFVEEVDFGSIRCGDCLRQSVNIINTGYLSSHWYATIEESLKLKSKTKSSFFLLTQEGILEPGEKFYLRVYFEPHYDDFLNADLIITVDGNDRETIVQLKGFGMEPYLEIIEDKICFDPNIPYSCSDKFVSIRNASKFSVDFFFADFDQSILQEEFLVRAYIVGHMMNKVYFPYRAPGEDLPTMFQVYHDYLLNEVLQKMVEKRDLASEARSLKSKTRTTGSPRRRSRQYSWSSWLSPRGQRQLQYGFDEREEMFHAYLLKKFKIESSSVISGKLQSADSEPLYEDPPWRGTLIVFHGAPLSDYTKAANETGKSLNIPVYTIDRLIIECLVRNISIAAQEINDAINAAFDEVAEDFERESVIEEDSFEVMTKKVRILLEGRKKNKKPKENKPKSGKEKSSNKNSKSSKKSSKGSSKGGKSVKTKDINTKQSSKSSKTDLDSKIKKKQKKSNSESSKSPHSSKTEKKSKQKKQVLTDTLLNLPQSTIRMLLTEGLKKFPQGLVIESLESNFLRKTMVAIHCILEISKEVDNICFIIFSFTFDKYMELEDHNEESRVENDYKILEELMASIDNMDSTEFAALKQNYPSVYRNYIGHRKDLIIQRKELIKRKKLQMQKQLESKMEKEQLRPKSKTKIHSRESSKGSKKSKKKSSKSSSKSKKSKSVSKTSKISSKGGSKKSSKKSKSSGKSKKSTKQKKKRKLTPLEADIKSRLDTFENSLQEIIHNLEFWDRKNSFLIKPYKRVEGNNKKQKGKKSMKSARSGVTSTLSVVGSSHQVSSDIGVPCWIVDVNYLNNKEIMIPQFVKAANNAEVLHQQQIKDENTEPPLLQSVLRVPKIRSLKKTDIFNITHHTEDKDVSAGTQSKNKLAEESKLTSEQKRSSKIKSIISTHSSDTPLKHDKFVYRKLLQPGEIIKYKVSFLPKMIGNYKHQFEIGVVGYPVKFTITCVAACDIPRIDMTPLNLFSRVVETRTDRNKYARGVYVEDCQKYEFGGILLPNPSTKTSFESKACFNLNNISRITCELSVTLIENCPAFEFYPDFHVIEPKCKTDQMVMAAPLQEHVYDDVLTISIKNNPKVEKIRLSCFGCGIGVDVNPKHVIFERVTLELSLAKNITITNNTPVEVLWYFVNCNEVLQNFNIQCFNGRILPFCYDTATVFFTAKEMNIKSSIFQVNIYDTHGRLVYATDIMVTAETTHLEFFYRNEIDYGDVKGWKTHSMPFQITSKGRYEILCQFSDIVEEGTEEQAYRQYFKLQPNEGKVLPDIKFEANIIFSPDKVMTLEKLPVFKCSLIDGFHQVVVKAFNIYVSAKVFLSKFEICPYPEIYFGYQTVGSENIHTFEIINKGKFDFDYTIKHCAKEEEKESTSKKKGKNKNKSKSKSKSSNESKKSKQSKGSKGSGKKSKDSKESKMSKKSKASRKSKSSKKSKTTSTKSEKKKKKSKSTTLNFGIFSLTSSTGTVYPNDREIIEVRSKPIYSGEFQESIIINVSEPSSYDRNGKLLKVQVIACEPNLNFEEVTNIFKDQYIVEKMDDFLASNFESKVIFAKSEKKLKFNKICVNTTEVTRIRIHNVGHVSARVTAKFSTTNHIFTVSPEIFTIDSYQSEIVMIIYTPTSLDEHRSTLTLECRGFRTVQSLVIEVIGESCVPEIMILEPETENTTSITTSFTPTIIGNSSVMPITIQNIGPITCKVILDLCFDDYDQLVLSPTEKTIPYLNLWDINVPMKHTNLVNLECKAIAKFILKFKPSKTGIWKSELKVHTLNNPFETKTINILCEGYYADVILEGLPCCTKNTSQDLHETAILGYSLDYGHISLNTLEKKCFLIKNNSANHIYKFEFPNYIEVIFSPTVGHIGPLSSKQVIATFLSRSPVDFKETKLQCKVYRIELLESQACLPAWDDRQNFVVWCPEIVQNVHNLDTQSETSYQDESFHDESILSLEEHGLNMKKIEENPEPQITVVPDSSQNLTILLSIVAAYASYTIEPSQIEIEDTFVMNKKSTNFTVKNTGNVNLKVNWFVSMKDLPRRINSYTCMNKIEEALVPVSSSDQPILLSGREHFMFEEPMRRASSASTLFSGDSADTNRSAASWTDAHSLPFTIIPEKALIEPNAEETFTVTFAPVDVFEYVIQLKSYIENKPPKEKEAEVEVKARSILPVYCFELEPSDYVKKRRLGRKMCNELFDENTQVVEFETIGLGIICTKKFFLKNPTKEEFMYSWQSAENTEPHLSSFHCHTPTGIVYKGENVEMVFSFIPQSCGTIEEFYFFNIPVRDIQVCFLMVGTAREPNVYFDQSHIDLPPTIVGIPVTNKIVLKNEEKSRFTFKFGNLPICSEGISINPSNGILESEEEYPIEIHYNPKKKGSADFDIRCSIQNIKVPLEISVSCTCFEIAASANYVNHYGKEVQLHVNKLNVVNMGAMVPNQKYEVPISVVNIGKIGFQWYWDMRIDKISGLFDILTDSSDEILQPNQKLRTRLTIIPLITTQMWPHRLIFKIPYGPSYSLQLNGTAGRPPFKLSFTTYNFGPCLVQTCPSKFYKATLRISNFNIFPTTLEVGKHEQHLSTDFNSDEIPPQNHLIITIYFHPYILGDHNLELPLYIDGKKTHVTILGKAVPLKLALVDQINKFVDLGSVLVGKTCTKTIRVANESQCPVNMFINFWDRLPKIPRKEKPDDNIEIPAETSNTPKSVGKGKKDKKDSAKKKKAIKGKDKKGPKKSQSSKINKKTNKNGSKKGSKKSKNSKISSKKSAKSKKSSKQNSQEVKKMESAPQVIPKKGLDYMTVSPGKWQKVASQRVAEFTITYTPQERVEPFSEKIFYQIQNCIDALCMVKGAAIAPNIFLDKTNLTFANVVVNFARIINVVLKNTGDVPLRFKWELEKNEENYSIQPNKGYILPHTDIIFKVFFRPKTVKCWIKSKIICHIPSINKQLRLNLCGSCIAVPPPKATIIFSCPVRTSDIKSITIMNPSNKFWVITPQIAGADCFETVEITRIPPQTEDKVEVYFKPQVMQDHSATLCIPTPDGLTTTYTLQGIATPPISEKITRDVLCKVQHLEKLCVKNWLLVKQQFTISTTVSGHATAKNLFSVAGNTLIEVPPSGSRTYDWLITPINEGSLELKVMFTNKVTKEYQSFDISLNVLPNKQLDVIEFTTCARNFVTKLIKLENPLSIPLVYTMSCSKENVHFEKTVTLDPHSVYYLEVQYKPLHEEEVTKTFEATCKEMGSFPYTFILKARPPVPESAIMFKSYLGQTLIENVEIVDTKTCQFVFSDPVFSLHSVVGPHTLRIIFEPTQTGWFQSELLVQSPTLGDFIYPLIAECCPPKPQGPFLLSFSNPVAISFKNPFSEDKEFFFRIEPSDFSIKDESAMIPSKKIFKVMVQMLKNRNAQEVKYVTTGKLTITCQSPETSWVYYLQEGV